LLFSALGLPRVAFQGLGVHQAPAPRAGEQGWSKLGPTTDADLCRLRAHVMGTTGGGAAGGTTAGVGSAA
jgi:hypothetical protein